MLRRCLIMFLPLVCVLVAIPGQATMVKKMDLVEMCQLAGRIFRGTVVDIDKGTVLAGGGEVPTITYQIKVAEQLKGSFPAPANGESILSITTVNIPIVDMPRLAVGQDYLLLTTTPSSAGLSAMVGLGQGTFKIYGKSSAKSSAEMAVNALNNVGLANGLRGPLSYRDIADRVRSILQSRGPK